VFVPDVLVVGDLNPDILLRGDVVPRFGQSEQLLESADLMLGGSAGIVAHAFGRLGVSVALAAVVGDDAFGTLAREWLAAAGVDVGPVRVHPDLPTGLTVVLGLPDTRTMLTLPGAMGALTAADVGDGALAGVRHVHATSFYLQPALAAGLAGLFRRARALGATTSLDTNVDPTGTWGGLGDVLPVTDVLLPNRAEALGIAAAVGHAGDDVEAAAAAIARRGPLVVVKDGGAGAVAVAPSGAVVRAPAVPVAAVETTGAGDTFDAAFVAARLRGLPLGECLALACHAGALSTRAVGGTAAQPTAAELGL
jgi:sugar/nucleoside kinase (ribokinase family)